MTLSGTAGTQNEHAYIGGVVGQGNNALDKLTASDNANNGTLIGEATKRRMIAENVTLTGESYPQLFIVKGAVVEITSGKLENMVTNYGTLTVKAQAGESGEGGVNTQFLNYGNLKFLGCTMNAGNIHAYAGTTVFDGGTYHFTIPTPNEGEPSNRVGLSFVSGTFKDLRVDNGQTYLPDNDFRDMLATGSSATKDEQTHTWTVTKSNEESVQTYTLSYVTHEDEGIALSSNITDTSGDYSLKFICEGEDFEISISSDDYTAYPLGVMFAGEPATVYTKVIWEKTTDEVTTSVASLDKSLTITQSGEAIQIRTFSATQSEESAELWNMIITPSSTVDSSAKYVLYAKTSDGASTSTNLNVDENGKLISTNGSSCYTEGVKLYVQKIAGEVDGQGNATLTYTPLGTGYDWTATTSNT